MNSIVSACLALIDRLHKLETDGERRAWLHRLRGNVAKLGKDYG